MKIELTVPIDEIGLPLPCLEHQTWVLAALVGDMQTIFRSPDRHLLTVSVPKEDALVARDRGIQRESALTVKFAGISNTADRSNDDLRGQIGEGGAGIVASKFVQVDLSKDLSVPRPLRQIGSRLINLLHCALEGVCLFRRRVQLHLRDQYHVRITVRMFKSAKYRKGGRINLPVETGSLLRQ